jgi:IS30 family transposase
MRTYTQLTRGKRYQIRALLKAGFSQSEMAYYLRVNKSTISREIRRNRGDKGYRPRQAYEKALARRYAALVTKQSISIFGLIKDRGVPFTSTCGVQIANTENATEPKNVVAASPDR